MAARGLRAFRASRSVLAPPRGSVSGSEGVRAESAARAARPGRLDVHPRVALQTLRHSKIAVTMEICTEIPSAATRDALNKLGRWLDT
jgi:hypothetical protein